MTTATLILFAVGVGLLAADLLFDAGDLIGAFGVFAIAFGIYRMAKVESA